MWQNGELDAVAESEQQKPETARLQP